MKRHLHEGARRSRTGWLRLWVAFTLLALLLPPALALQVEGIQAQAAPVCTNSSSAVTLPSGAQVCTDRWMADMASTIGQRPLSQLVIPGSHDSGTYTMNDYERTQNDNLWLQAQKGIRQFDIRPKYGEYPWIRDPFLDHRTDYWIFHNELSNVRLTTTLRDIKSFITAPGHEKEVIIMEFMQRSGDDPNEQRIAEICNGIATPGGAYDKSIDLRPYLIRKSDLTPGRRVDDLTLEEIWKLPGGRRIISNWDCDGQGALDGKTLGYYAGNCYAKAFSTQTGIINAIAGALEGRYAIKNGGEYFDEHNVYDTSRSVTGFYSLSIATTTSGHCATPIYWREPEADLVLDALLDYHTNNSHNARQNLNMVAGDFVETSNLVSYTLQMNDSPTISVKALVGPAFVAPFVANSVTNQSVKLEFTCSVSHSIVKFGLNTFVVSGAVSDSTTVPGSPGAADPTTGRRETSISGIVTRDGDDQSAAAVCIDPWGREVRKTFGGINIDKTPPTVTLASDAPAVVPAGAPFTVTATFSEDVAGFDANDISLTNATLVPFTLIPHGSARSTFLLQALSTGPVIVDIAAGAVVDRAGNGNLAAARFSIDRAPPTVTLDSPAPAVVRPGVPITVTATFSEDVAGSTFVPVNVVVTNAALVPSFFPGGTSHSFIVISTGVGPLTVDFPAGAVVDLAGNGNFAAPQFSRQVASP
jgi:hypothetical protein